MTFPVCAHAKRKTCASTVLGWLASEPFRVFFFTGAVWSIVGVSLWPLYYAQQIGFYPNLVHARLMIEGFGAAFVVGFLGTAGPRMVSAPKLTPLELIWLCGLHQACAVSHLLLQLQWGDGFFVVMMVSLLGSLGVRVVRHGKNGLPPQMVLALTGLICGVAGAVLLMNPAGLLDAERLRLANLLLYQGLLLPPVLGIGSFLFPRLLGGGFGEPKGAGQNRVRRWRALGAAGLLVGSFFLEAQGRVGLGCAMRATVAVVYLLVEVRWKAVRCGSLTTGLFWALGLGLCGLGLPAFFYDQHVSIEHLLYAGGFGLLMLVVGSRVLFGHSGDLEGFSATSKWVRFLVFLAVLAATTRATPAWVPSTTVSHHIYAACTWGLLVLLWLVWHRRRFVKRDDD